MGLDGFIQSPVPKNTCKMYVKSLWAKPRACVETIFMDPQVTSCPQTKLLGFCIQSFCSWYLAQWMIWSVKPWNVALFCFFFKFCIFSSSKDILESAFHIWSVSNRLENMGVCTAKVNRSLSAKKKKDVCMWRFVHQSMIPSRQFVVLWEVTHWPRLRNLDTCLRVCVCVFVCVRVCVCWGVYSRDWQMAVQIG